MTSDSDAAFDAALALAGLTPDPHDREAALRIALFLRACRGRLRAIPDLEPKS